MQVSPYWGLLKPMSNKRNEIRIRDVNPALIEDLNNIAKNQGFGSTTQFLKVQLRKIRDSYPDRFRQKD